MTKYLTLPQSLKIYGARKSRDANTRLMHKAFVKLMLVSGRQDHTENVFGMMAGELSKEMTRRRASRNAALLKKPVMPGVGHTLTSAQTRRFQI